MQFRFSNACAKTSAQRADGVMGRLSCNAAVRPQDLFFRDMRELSVRVAIGLKSLFGRLPGKEVFDHDKLELMAVVAAFLWISSVYVSATFMVARSKSFWMDEALAVSTARMRSFGDIAAAIWNGAELSPPTYHFFLHILLGAFPGADPLLLPRLPSIAAVFVAALCVYALVRPHAGRLVAIAAFAFALDSGLFSYAVQARPYALMAAGLACSLALWSDMEARRFAGLRAGLLWLLLCICVCLHFYGFVAPATIGVAEALWLATRKELRRRVWVSLLAVLPALLAWLPLGLHLKAFVLQDAAGSEYYGRPTLSLLQDAVFESLVSGDSGAQLILAALVLCAFAHLWRRFERSFGAGGAGEGGRPPQATMSKNEIAASALFLTPFIAFAFSVLFSSTFAGRYVSAASLFSALFFGAAARTVPFRGAVACALLPLVAFTLETRGAAFPRGSAASAWSALAETKDDSLPIVIGEGMTFIELTEAADPKLRQRMIFLLAPQTATLVDPTYQNQVKRLADLHPELQVREEEAFVASAPCFYVLFRPEDVTGATVASLMRQGLLEQPLKVEGGIWLMRAGRACRRSSDHGGG